MTFFLEENVHARNPPPASENKKSALNQVTRWVILGSCVRASFRDISKPGSNSCTLLINEERSRGRSILNGAAGERGGFKNFNFSGNARFCISPHKLFTARS